MINLKIDPEFQNQIPPLTDDEYKQLEENILKEGKLLSPLIVWNNTLVDADMHRLARADFPNRKQIVHEILHPEDRPSPQKRIYGINYSALEAAVRRIQQDVDFLMKYLPKVPDDAYVKVETTKILKQHKAYMAQFEEMLNDKEIA